MFQQDLAKSQYFTERDAVDLNHMKWYLTLFSIYMYTWKVTAHCNDVRANQCRLTFTYAHKCFQNRRCSFILLWFSLKENQNMAKNNIQRRKQLTMDKPHHFIAYGSKYTSWPAGRVLNRHTPPRDNSWEGFTWDCFTPKFLILESGSWAATNWPLKMSMLAFQM